MTKERREKRLPDAVAHSVVPPEGETVSQSPEAEVPATEAVPNGSGRLDSLEEGPMIRQAEDLFPLVWLAMLTVVCVVGVYNAVSGLPQF